MCIINRLNIFMYFSVAKADKLNILMHQSSLLTYNNTAIQAMCM